MSVINKHIIYEDLYDFWLYAFRESDAYEKSSRGYSREWNGNVTWLEAKKLALQGWQDGLEQVKKYQTEIEYIKKFAKTNSYNQDLAIMIDFSIHSGKNRVIRRMFEAIGNEVLKLDRVMFHTFDKRGLQKGSWRELTDKELKGLEVYLRTKK